MGAWLSALMGKKKQINAVMLGLDSAGKTSLLFRLKYDKLIVTIPSVGFNLEKIETKNMTFSIWDVGARAGRQLWQHYFDNTTDWLVWVIDSTDHERLSESSDDFRRVLGALPPRVKIILLANKQDHREAKTVSEITDVIKSKELMSRTWYILPTSALDGSGLDAFVDTMQRV